MIIINMTKANNCDDKYNKTGWVKHMDMNLDKYLSFVKTVEYGGFTKAPEILETVFLQRDKLVAVIAEDHPLRECKRFPAAALCEEPL